MRWKSFQVLVPLVASCTGGTGLPAGNLLRGTVHHLDLEGGVYVIDVNDSLRYQPLNLPREMEKDGLVVKFSVRSRDDVMGTAQVGKIVDLVTITADSAG